MSNVDINVDRRTDWRTDGRTDGQKIGRLYCTLLQAGAIKIHFRIGLVRSGKMTTFFIFLQETELIIYDHDFIRVLMCDFTPLFWPSVFYVVCHFAISVWDISHATSSLIHFQGMQHFKIIITKTRLFKYIEIFTSKNWTFSDKKKTLIFFIFLIKT